MRVREEEKASWCLKLGLNTRSLRQAVSVREQLCSFVERLRLPVPAAMGLSSVERGRNLKRCLCHGFFMQTAIYDRDGFYLTAKESHRARIHPSSAVKGGSTWILYNELIETSGVYLRTVTQIEGKWLAEIAPFYFDVTTCPEGRMKQELMHLYQELLL